jgi:hypothetical protein
VLLDLATNAVRSVLRVLDGAEAEVEKPVADKLEEAISALHRTADSMDRHVEVVAGLAASLPALTEVLAKLSGQLGEVLEVAAPLEAAEHGVAGIGRLFHRHHHDGDADSDAGPPA